MGIIGFAHLCSFDEIKLAMESTHKKRCRIVQVDKQMKGAAMFFVTYGFADFVRMEETTAAYKQGKDESPITTG